MRSHSSTNLILHILCYTCFAAGPADATWQLIHRVHLKNLTAGTSYTYQCGNNRTNLSDAFEFKTYPNGSDWSPRFLVYGDFGLVDDHSLSFLEAEIGNGTSDLILHNGDFAYDLYNKDGQVGDDFMNAIQPFAARVPYMVSPGNHESRFNFSNYRNRFTMPAFEETENLWYSVDIGPVHLVSVDTEIENRLYPSMDPGLIARHKAWLLKDLEQVDREKTPWIITQGHRPTYCSNPQPNYVDCALTNSTVRTWLEPVLHEYGVDLAFWAHQHNYERMLPEYL